MLKTIPPSHEKELLSLSLQAKKNGYSLFYEISRSGKHIFLYQQMFFRKMANSHTLFQRAYGIIGNWIQRSYLIYNIRHKAKRI